MNTFTALRNVRGPEPWLAKSFERILDRWIYLSMGKSKALRPHDIVLKTDIEATAKKALNPEQWNALCNLARHRAGLEHEPVQLSEYAEVAKIAGRAWLKLGNSRSYYSRTA